MNVRVRDAKAGRTEDKWVHAPASDKEIAEYGEEVGGTTEAIGWRPTCGHTETVERPEPCLVLEPFHGYRNDGAGRHAAEPSLRRDRPERGIHKTGAGPAFGASFAAAVGGAVAIVERAGMETPRRQRLLVLHLGESDREAQQRGGVLQLSMPGLPRVGRWRDWRLVDKPV